MVFHTPLLKYEEGKTEFSTGEKIKGRFYEKEDAINLSYP